MLWTILGIFISYIIGSIPTAYIFTLLIKGVDIRKVGSGNVGATNATRILGKGLGLVVLVLDILKGLLPVVFLGDLIIMKTVTVSPEFLRIILGISCIAGHNWTIFLNFRGGKGVATTLGVLLGLAIKISGLKVALLSTILVWLLFFFLTKIVSLSSIIAAVLFPLFLILFRQSAILITTGLLLTFFIIIRHKSNLMRIMQGKESRLNLKK